MKPSDCVGTTGPTTTPLDLKSKDVELRSQSDPTRDGSNPKEDAMLKMIRERVGSDLDECSGMPCNASKPSRAFVRDT